MEDLTPFSAHSRCDRQSGVLLLSSLPRPAAHVCLLLRVLCLLAALRAPSLSLSSGGIVCHLLSGRKLCAKLVAGRSFAGLERPFVEVQTDLFL